MRRGGIRSAARATSSGGLAPEVDDRYATRCPPGRGDDRDRLGTRRAGDVPGAAALDQDAAGPGEETDPVRALGRLLDVELERDALAGPDLAGQRSRHIAERAGARRFGRGHERPVEPLRQAVDRNGLPLDAADDDRVVAAREDDGRGAGPERDIADRGLGHEERALELAEQAEQLRARGLGGRRLPDIDREQARAASRPASRSRASRAARPRPGRRARDACAIRAVRCPGTGTRCR